MLTRAYMRASTIEQYASRAKESLLAFDRDRALTVAATYIEKESAARLHRPGLVWLR